MNNYSLKSLKTLFTMYTYENISTNRDADAIKQKIRNELYIRVNEAFHELDKAETHDDAMTIYERFIGR